MCSSMELGAEDRSHCKFKLLTDILSQVWQITSRMVCLCVPAPVTQAVLQVRRCKRGSPFLPGDAGCASASAAWGWGRTAEASRSRDRSCLKVPSCQSHPQRKLSLSFPGQDTGVFPDAICILFFSSEVKKAISQKPSVGTDSARIESRLSPAKSGEKETEGRSYRSLQLSERRL